MARVATSQASESRPTDGAPASPGARRRGESAGFLYSAFGIPLPLERESALFLVVSILDVMMTYLLLSDTPGDDGRVVFYESNPVAAYFLNGWGVRGIVYFKFAMVALVVVIAHVVAIRKIEVGRRLLEFGTLVVSGVVIYSMLLSIAHH